MSLDDLATQSADDALVAVLAKLDDFRGESRFTTWAYKFALLEAAVRLRRLGWQGREVPLEPASWDALRRGGTSPHGEAETRELLGALRIAIDEELTPHQREVLVAITLTAFRSTCSPSASTPRAARSTRRCTTRARSCAAAWPTRAWTSKGVAE